MNKLIILFKNQITKGNPRSVKLKRNIGGSFLIKGASIILSLIKVPILLTYLDAEKYGVWLTIASIVMWVNHFDLGLGHGLRNKLGEAIAQNDVERGKKLVSTAYVSLSILMFGALFLLIPVVFILNWNDILNVHSIDNKELTYSVLVVLIFFILRFIFQLISVILKADQRTARSDLYMPLSGFISLILVLIVRLFIQDSLFLACFIIAAPPVFVLAFANIYFFKKDYRLYKPSFKYADRKHLHDIFSLGLKFFLGQMVALVLFSSQNFILAQVVNPTEVTIFNIAKQYFALPLTFFMIILNPYWSAITDAYAKKEFGWIKSTMKKLNLISIVFTLGTILMLLISGFAYDIWIGERVSIPFSLSLMFATYNIFSLFLSPYNYFLNGVGKLNLGLISGIFKLLAYLPLAIFLTQKWAGLGLLIALLITNVIPNLLLNIVQYKMIINNRAYGIWNK